MLLCCLASNIANVLCNIEGVDVNALEQFQSDYTI